MRLRQAIIVFLSLALTLSKPVFAIESQKNKHTNKAYFVGMGSFSTIEAAKLHMQNINRQFDHAKVNPVEVDGIKRFRVYLGPFDSPLETSKVQKRAKLLGFTETWVFNQPIAPNRIEPKTSSVQGSTKNVHSDEDSRLSQRNSVYVSKFSYTTPVLENEIKELLSTLEQREVQRNELLAVKNQINQSFVKAGYINSGILIPDQRIDDGEVRLQMISGSLGSISLESKLNQRYLTSRLEMGEPFNLQQLQHSLKLLEQDPLISRIDAKVTPGLKPGEAALALRAETVPRFMVEVSSGNDRSPSIGSENTRVSVTSRNLTGWGEVLSLGNSVTRGLDAHDARLTVPLSSKGSQVSLEYSLSDSSVVEEPFDNIDVESETESVSLILSLPVMKTLTKALSLHLTLEARRNQTSLLNQNFSFSEGAIDGESKVAPARLAVAYTSQNANDSFSARFSISRGTSRFDATQNVDLPDGYFTSYLAQAQYSKLLAERFHVTTRALSQYTSDPLLSIERYSLGGVHTVRGYRQNQVVRDNAQLVSAEAHYRLATPLPLSLVAFVDWGRGENHKDAAAGGKRDLSSIGLGVLMHDWHGLSAQLYVAHGFEEFSATEYNLQDDGIHFQLRYYHEF